MPIKSIIFLFIGIVCLAVNFKILFANILFLKNAVTVRGTIVRYDVHTKQNSQTHENETWYAAVISFPFNGQMREITSSTSSSTASNGNIGQIRKVAINPQNNKVRLVKDVIGEMLLFSALLLFLGTICLLLGFIFSPYAPQLLAFIKSENGKNAIINFIHSYPNLFVGVAKSIKFIFVSLPFLLALTPGVFGAWLLYSRVTFFKNAIIVPGTIVKFIERHDNDKQHKHRGFHYTNSQRDNETETMYTPVISYSFNGQMRQITSHISSSHVNPSDIGKQCQVAINPQNTYEARIYSKWDYAIAIGLMCFSGILLIFILRRFI